MSDTRRQNEFVNSIGSALNVLGEELAYDYVYAVSGSAFRTSFSIKTFCEFNHGNYHVIHTPCIIEHTFKMLGYEISHYIRSGFSRDCKIIIINGTCKKPDKETIFSETIHLEFELIRKENMAIGQYNGQDNTPRLFCI